MAEPLAGTTDLEGLWRPLSPEEETVAANKLVIASELLRHHVPDVDDRITAGTLSRVLVRGVVVEAVKRSMQGDTEGVRSKTTTRGPFTESRTYRDAAEYGLFFTALELGTLGGGATAPGTRVGTIRTRSVFHPAQGATGPQWWSTWKT